MDIVNRLKEKARRNPEEPIWRDAVTEIERLRKAILPVGGYSPVNVGTEPTPPGDE